MKRMCLQEARVCMEEFTKLKEEGGSGGAVASPGEGWNVRRAPSTSSCTSAGGSGEREEGGIGDTGAGGGGKGEEGESDASGSKQVYRGGREW